MKKAIILLFCFYAFNHAKGISVRAYANQWMKDFIVDKDGDLIIPVQEFNAIKALIKISHKRSEQTLIAQQQALQALELLWHGWQNLAQTRLNPSKQRPFAIADIDKHEVCSNFWHALEKQEYLSEKYGYITERVVHGNVLNSTRAQSAVKDFRQQARVVMLDALTDVKKHLATLYEITFNKRNDPILDVQDPEDLTRITRFSMGDFLMSYIPNLVVHKFIEADKLYNSLSEEGWAILQKIQNIGNTAWHAIETARTAFYQALLDEIEVLE